MVMNRPAMPGPAGHGRDMSYHRTGMLWLGRSSWNRNIFKSLCRVIRPSAVYAGLDLESSMGRAHACAIRPLSSIHARQFETEGERFDCLPASSRPHRRRHEDEVEER